MMWCVFVFLDQCVMMIRPLLMCFILCVVYGSSKPTDRKSRVHDEEPLSHLKHDDNKNYDYDHEAFLGQDEAKTFDQLPPEESQRRLRWVQEEDKRPSAQLRHAIFTSIILFLRDNNIFYFVKSFQVQDKKPFPQMFISITCAAAVAAGVVPVKVFRCFLVPVVRNLHDRLNEFSLFVRGVKTDIQVFLCLTVKHRNIYMKSNFDRL